VPGANGVLTCFPTVCVPSCGTCSTSADCCPGTLCLGGICGPCGGGNPDGGTSTEAGPPSDSGLSCAAYGQICTQTSDCCNNIPCLSGRCQYVQ
jgi:hypothetical protein